MKKVIAFIFIISLFFNITVVQALDTSYSSVVIDMDSGRILYEKNKDDKRLIASITKIMTAVIAIENKNLDDIVVVGEEILPMYGSNIYLEIGEEMSLRDLLYGLILRSGNDAAVVIAKYVAGSEEKFVKLMNKKANILGMNDTIFNNCHGLDDETENYSSAYDMAKLMKYANTLMDFVEISGTYKWKTTSNKKTYIWYNRNKLLSDYKYATGGKTGYTPKAGKTLVSTASKNNLNLIAVTLKDSNHYETQKELYDYIFSKYKKTLIIDKNNIDLKNNLYSQLYIKNNFYYPLTDKEINNIKINIDLYQLDDYIDNQKVGEIFVTFDDKEIYRDNIYVMKKENKGSLLGKLLSFFSSLF